MEFIFDINKTPHLFGIDQGWEHQAHVYLSFMKCSLDFSGLKFQPSYFTLQQEEGKGRKVFDRQTRDSIEAYLHNQKLTSAANLILDSYLKSINQNLVEIKTEWRMIKYLNGHFTEHSDRNRPVKPYTHYGTQIWLPPKSLCQYEGGILIAKGSFEKQIEAHETNWTFIIMPLGVNHEVTQVKGERISFVKPIYIRNLQLQQKERFQAFLRTQNQLIQRFEAQRRHFQRNNMRRYD